MLQIAVPSVLAAVYRVNWDDDRTGGCKSIRYTGACRLFRNDEGRECLFI